CRITPSSTTDISRRTLPRTASPAKPILSTSEKRESRVTSPLSKIAWRQPSSAPRESRRPGDFPYKFLPDDSGARAANFHPGSKFFNSCDYHKRILVPSHWRRTCLPIERQGHNKDGVVSIALNWEKLAAIGTKETYHAGWALYQQAAIPRNVYLIEK